MSAPSDDLNDLEAEIGNLHGLLSVLVWELLEPRGSTDKANHTATALAIIARDMNERMIASMEACHHKVLAERAAAR